MISKKEKSKLLKKIGSRHIAQISKYLEDNGVKNRHGNSFSRQYISRVFNGGDSNKALEDHIYDFAAIREQENASEKSRRKQILNGVNKSINPKKEK